jgi:hypothetical protein
VHAIYRSDLLAAAQLELAQPTPLLDPAKYLVDATAGVD